MLRCDWSRLNHLFRSSLYANSFYLMAANVVNAAFGFFFWTAGARLYTPSEVGLAAATVSAIGLLAALSILGLDYAMVRFLPLTPDPQVIINSSLTIATVAALVLASGFVAGLGVWSRVLLPLRQSALFVTALITATVCTATTSLLASVFLARKQAHHVCAQSAVFGTAKLLFAFILVGVPHAPRLIGAWTLGLVVAVVYSMGFVLPELEGRRYRLRLTVAREAFNDMTHFAFANYVTAVLWSSPTYLLPLLVVTLAGPEANAYFYVASSISGLLAMIPTAVSLSLFSHGSHDDGLILHHVFESGKFTLWLLVPSIAAVFLLGGKLLLLFGKLYSGEATRLLWMLALGTLPLTVNFLFFSVRRVQQRMGAVLVSAVWILSVTLGLSALLLPRMGLFGVGVAWFVAQASVALTILTRYALGHR